MMIESIPDSGRKKSPRGKKTPTKGHGEEEE